VASTGAKLDQKYKAWNKVLGDAVKGHKKAPSYLEFCKAFEKEWAQKNTPDLWRQATEIDM